VGKKRKRSRKKKNIEALQAEKAYIFGPGTEGRPKEQPVRTKPKSVGEAPEIEGELPDGGTKEAEERR